MGELPEGMEMPKSEITTPHPLASVILSRERSGGHEILLGHRVSELPAFPESGPSPGGESEGRQVCCRIPSRVALR
ncbi:MAG: hypothetical protein Ct9H300mP30_2660 [Methanobacteriota archaeon]|nr:MAG: hypothetical protein Ct9H300mP30_2660 [Euryarchaeota archaeon]